MKKLLSVLVLGVLLTSCSGPYHDVPMLQTTYPIVYTVNSGNYICIDSIGTYHIRVTIDGRIYSTIRIK